jgi:hypothetical protein
MEHPTFIGSVNGLLSGVAMDLLAPISADACYPEGFFFFISTTYQESSVK